MKRIRFPFFTSGFVNRLPILDEAVSACVLVQIVGCTALTRFAFFNSAFQKVVVLSDTVNAGARHHAFQAIHLPHIPRNDVGNVGDGFNQGVLAKFVAVMFDERKQQGFAGQEQVIALPFVGINAFIGFLCSLQPFARSRGVFANDAELRSSKPMRRSTGIKQPVVVS